MMMSDELLPCPFCRGEGRLEQMVIGWRVGCPPARCSFSGPYSANKDAAEAIVAWNTRAGFAGISDPAAFVEAARDMMKSLSSMRCQTMGPEDMEPGCCGPCRARDYAATFRATGAAK
jgi:hypothetical protein